MSQSFPKMSALFVAKIRVVCSVRFHFLTKAECESNHPGIIVVAASVFNSGRVNAHFMRKINQIAHTERITYAWWLGQIWLSSSHFFFIFILLELIHASLGFASRQLYYSYTTTCVKQRITSQKKTQLKNKNVSIQLKVQLATWDILDLFFMILVMKTS